MEKISKKGVRTTVNIEGVDPVNDEAEFEIIIDLENDTFAGKLGDARFTGDWSGNLRKFLEVLLAIEGGD